MNGKESKQVKLKFRLEKDADGYPPVEVENIGADDLGDGRYQIDNIPFYAYNISWQDVVSAEEREGELWYTSTTVPSDHSTVRVIFFDDCPEEKKEEALQFLRENGCTYEGFTKDLPLFSIDVPPSSDYLKVIRYLRNEEDRFWGVEESSFRHKL